MGYWVMMLAIVLEDMLAGWMEDEMVYYLLSAVV